MITKETLFLSMCKRKSNVIVLGGLQGMADMKGQQDYKWSTPPYFPWTYRHNK